MKWTILPCLAVTLLAALTVQRAEAQEEKRKIAVLALKLETDLAEGIGNTLNEIMLHEFQKIGNLQVLSASDVLSVLNLEEKRMTLGCTDDSCLVELGGALGVPLLASPSIGAVGNQYVINLKVMDVTNAIVLARSSEIVPRDDSELIRAVKKSVANVVGAMGLEKKTTAAPVEATEGLEVTAAPEKPRSFMDIAPWLTLGLTVAAGGTAATLGVLAKSDADASSGEFEGTARWNDLKDSGGTKAIAADVLYGVACAAAVTTLILFLVGDDEEEPAASVSVMPIDSGTTASFSARF